MVVTHSIDTSLQAGLTSDETTEGSEMAEHIERNEASRAELAEHGRRVVAGEVGDRGDGWSASTVLAHVAFWDRLMYQRWRTTLRYGRRYPDPIPDGLEDLINDSAVHVWSAVSPEVAAAEATAAAEELDAFLAGVADDVVAELRITGKSRLVDRSFHRRDHIAGD